MRFPSPLKATIFAISGLVLSATMALAAAPSVPNACDMAKAAQVTKIIGPDAKFIPLIDRHDAAAAMSMCAYEGKDGKHYGFSIRRVAHLPEGMNAHKMLNKAIETLMRKEKSADSLRQPKIGDAALWNGEAQQLSVWLDDGKTQLLFIGDKTTPALKTHLALARRIMAQLH